MELSSAKKTQLLNYKSISYTLYAVILVLAAAFPILAGQYYARYVIVMFITIIISIGYNISSGYCGLVHFASAPMYAAGAYGAAVMMVRFDMPFIVGLLFGILAACFVSLFVSIPAFRVSGHYLALISLGLVEIVQEVLVEWKGVTAGPAGMYLPNVSFLGSPLTWMGQYYFIFAVMLLSFIIQRSIVKSYLGRAFRSIKNDAVAATSAGINVRLFMFIAILISGIFAGTAGALYAGYSGYISPDTFGFDYTVYILLVVVIGGSGTLAGPLVGTLIITVLPEFFNASPDIKLFFYGLLLIVITISMPDGISGKLKKYLRAYSYERIPDSIEIKKYVALADCGLEENQGADESEDIMELNNLTKYFGGLAAVSNLNLKIKTGSIYSLIGPNGAGKSTTVNMITGMDRASTGEVIFRNQTLNLIEPYLISGLGIARTFQHVRLFGKMTVLENIMVGKHLAFRYGILGTLFRTPKMRYQETLNKEKALAYLDTIGLLDKANEVASSLSYGQQKLLDLARALAMEPKLLLLDEPCAGLNEAEINYFANLIKRIRNSGITILLIEHHMKLVMDISDRIIVLEYGKKIAEGNPKEIQENSAVREAYLGTAVAKYA
ncbi:branched-chain amino acid ABC transporter ATP-binding protein/permease [Desulfosporosinus sp. PR]|uniref:branched-chain amino acid ABC transporter ATP-binding protein/permease n=1 Tax=Candidatus Desulfosporosinus nitrosoreducens TaxID=3401928 RepID=UPI0027ED4A0B|nr:branched-chain amino acid ABC transporter ATP-binding protein/permease [Desulfosporosinus sp. PR]MDQ7093234.1 branched-chain amino acid ABC transporter ATP-binding protein/permease [Desulfosporosinus sp. PR]